MFEYRRGHGCLSVFSVVCCQVQDIASGRSLVQRSSPEFGVCECDHETPQWEAMTRNRVEASQENFFFVLLQNGQLETEGIVYYKEKVMRAEGGWI